MAIESISEKDMKRRGQILSGNIWKIMLSIGIPLVLQQCIHHFFNMIDSGMAVNIDSNAVASISYISQLMMLLTALGTGLSLGVGIRISEAFGAGDFKRVKTLVSTLIGFCFVLCLLVLVTLPFSEHILRLFNTPEAFISCGKGYFIFSVLSRIVDFFNLSYQAIERSRGNTKLILLLNLRATVIKFVLTSLFIYVFHAGVVMIAVATLISHISISITAIKNLTDKNSIFGFSIKEVNFSKKIAFPLLRTFLPVSFEKAFFNFGKVIVNSMSTFYGELTVGAIGITQIFTGFVVVPLLGMQSAAATIISQNLGANKPKRAYETFRKLFLFNVITGTIGSAIAFAIRKPMSIAFSANDPLLASLIAGFYFYDVFGVVPMGISDAVTALIYGTGRTRLAMILNFSRLFLFRIPILYYIQHFVSVNNSGAAVGVAVMLSNINVAVISLILLIFVVRDINNKYGITFLPEKNK